MTNRIFDSSQLTKRRAEKAIAGSFLTRLYPPNTTTPPQPGFGRVLGIYDSSVMTSVKTGQMTEFTRYPLCIGISPGCPCPELNASIIATPNSPSIPGLVSGITFTVGSIIISWIAPTTGNGPFTYIVTPYLNGVTHTAITTSNTTYRFTDLAEWQPYTFTVCAMNSVGTGPALTSNSYFISPPDSLSIVMSGDPTPVAPEPSLKYIINSGIDSILKYIALTNLGPTKGSRYIYIWVTSVVGAWNWVQSESRISGTHDNWNWNTKAIIPLSSNDALIWICAVIDYITPFFIPTGYASIYNCPADVINRVKTDGEWSTWQAAWQTWYNYRQADGYVAAATAQPTSSANWADTIIVDDTTINNISGFPQPLLWTRLTVQDRKQNYLTYNWDAVLSSCLTELQEQTIQTSVEPSTGLARDAEINTVRDYTAALTDTQKIIAEFWAGGPGTVSPPLMFIWMWKEYIRILPTITCPNIMFSLQDLVVHLFEGARVTWRLKTAYMEARPIQEIRRRFSGQSVVSWNGTVDGSQWTPYQEANFVTPPFADFPSGHSHFSKAFALTMNKWFGTNITKTSTYYDQQMLISPLFATNQTKSYGDFTVAAGSSLVQVGVVPAATVSLSFSTWNDIADQAGISRLYGGIHALKAHTSSQLTAIAVDGIINSTWNIQTLFVSPVISAPTPTPTQEPVVAPEPVPEPVVAPEPVPEPVVAPVPEPVVAPVSEPVVAPEPVPEPVVAPVSEPVVAPEPVHVPAPTVPYKIAINYTSNVPSQNVQNLINTSIQIIESIIATSHGRRLPDVSLDYDMIVDIDMRSLGVGILASARPTLINDSVSPAIPLRQVVSLNSDRLNESSLLSTVTFNNTAVVMLIPVMIHEMLHGLGIASLQTGHTYVGWDQFLDSNKVWYTGPENNWNLSEAIKAYREIVGPHVYRIPVENSFGQGTAYSHWEEGMKDGFVKEDRFYDYGSGNVFHPALPEEIMTGIAGNKFYFTKLTAGALVDHGYNVNMNSPNIVPYPKSFIQPL